MRRARRTWLLSVILLASIPANAANSERGKVTRASLSAVEKSFNQELEKLNATDSNPVEVLGLARGVYLEGYGAVITAEVNLIMGPGPSPFRPPMTQQEKDRIRQRKLERVPLLKDVMRRMLIETAAALDGMPPAEHVVLGVSLFSGAWEDNAGLPGQILMQADRQSLLDFRNKKIKASELDARIRVQEF